MRRTPSISHLALVAVLLCVGISGCKPSFPYYTTEGSIESRIIEVHVAEDQIIKVPCGLGMGGGLDGKLPDENNIITVEKDGVIVKVELQAGGAVPIIREVTYNGKKCAAHEEVL
jgi:hypothetical protein